LDAEYYRILTQIHRGIPHINRNKVTEVTKISRAVLGSSTEDPWKHGKIEHENGY